MPWISTRVPAGSPGLHLAACCLAACLAFPAHSAEAPAGAAIPIKHVIIIMQENRSFDSYFGTFPGANGIPAGICVPFDPSAPQKGCAAPFHDPHDANAGGLHSSAAAQSDIDDGITTNRMDGFVYSQASQTGGSCRQTPGTPKCAGLSDGRARRDVMGYHDRSDIPNYWAYASNFVLQDALFEGERSYSWPSHLELASEWAAVCTDYMNVATCTTSNETPEMGKHSNLPWANLFQLLDAHAVSWKYYLAQGETPDCEDGEMDCPPQVQTTTVPSTWNPMPFFLSVKQQGQSYITVHNPPLEQFYADIAAGVLPQVSWVVPTNVQSEHAPNGITAGMEYVTALVNAVATSPYWNDTAIFVAWDDWGGFYDHVPPPVVDTNTTSTPVQGFGLRVPGLLISAYAKRGMIDHAVLSFDSYATFFEDLFAGGARMDPAKLGTPDSRPDIRDALTSVRMPDGSTAPIGNLKDEFDFRHPPRPPLILSTHIPTQIEISCRGDLLDVRAACTTPTVNVSWAPVTGPSVPGPFTYHVTRDGVALPQCTVTSAGCTDSPGSGAHLYRVYSVDQNGVASPLSAAAEADEP